MDLFTAVCEHARAIGFKYDPWMPCSDIPLAQLHIDPDGNPVALVPVTPDYKFEVPRQGRCDRTSGDLPFLLCDTASYLLGVDAATGKVTEGSRKRFEASKRAHLTSEEVSKGDPSHGFAATFGLGLAAALPGHPVTRFFETWDPDKAAGHPVVGPALGSLVAAHRASKGSVVELWVDWPQGRGGTVPATSDPEVRALVEARFQDSKEGPPSSVSGEPGPVCRIHPRVKGIAGGSSQGDKLSFSNCPSCEPYGAKQGEVAHMSEEDAAAFAFGLKDLLERHSVRDWKGARTLLIWTDDLDAAKWEPEMRALMDQKATYMSSLLSAKEAAGTAWGKDPELRRKAREEAWAANDAALEAAVRSAYWGSGKKALPERLSYQVVELRGSDALRRGSFVSDIGQETAREMARRAKAHAEASRVERADRGPKWLPPEDVARALHAVRPGDGQDAEVARDAWQLAKAAREGRPQPRFAAALALRRAEATGEVTHGVEQAMRCHMTEQLGREDILPGLNEEIRTAPYLVGRAFAELKSLQDKAVGNPKAGIRERSLAALTKTPRRTLAQLLEQEAVWARRLAKRDPAAAAAIERRVSEILDAIDPATLPTTFDPDERVEVYLGYEQQRQANRKAAHEAMARKEAEDPE